MGDVLKKFGRYFLLDHVAQGGMAEIYRARLAGLDGSGRLLVIKRIQAGFGSDNEFIQMFRSETKVMMGFNHPNIIQLYDFGEETGQPYIAMEFVDGRNLRQISSRLNERKLKFPVDAAAHIIEQAASGLHYAHSFRDKMTGQAINLVHRDISPQNILISYEGSVKIIDFGIAKTAINAESTRAGVIKGKPAYLSPEQISGEVLDGRSDIFSLGTVLWELLVGKKLFAAESDLGVLKLIESCQTHVKPPSTLNPKVPKELDYIVLKCLHKNRNERYQTGEELQRALHKFVYSFNPDFNPTDVAVVARDLFREEILEDRRKIQRLNDEAEKLLVPGLGSEIELGATHRFDAENSRESTAVLDRRPSHAEEPKLRAPERLIEAQLNNTPVVELEGRLPPRPPGRTPGKPVPAAVTLPAAGATHPSAPPPPRQASPNQSLPVQPAMGTQVPGQPHSGSSLLQSVPMANASRAAIPRVSSVRMPAPASVAQPPRPVNASGGIGLGRVIAVLAAGLAAVAFLSRSIDIPGVTPLVSDLVGKMAVADGVLVLEGEEKGVTVMVNGRMVAGAIPVTLKSLPVGSAVRVTVTGEKGTFQQEFLFRQGERKSVPVSFLPERSISSVPVPQETVVVSSSKTILLRMNLMPGGGLPTVSLNGRPVEAANPVARVPLGEPLELVVERKGFHIFRREFVLDQRQLGSLRETLVDVPLQPLHPAGLTIRTTPSADATIMIDGKAWVTKTPIENVKLPAGSYDIKLTNDLLGMEKRITVVLDEGTVTTRDERLELKD